MCPRLVLVERQKEHTNIHYGVNPASTDQIKAQITVMEHHGIWNYGIGIVTGVSAVGDSFAASGTGADSYMWRRACC